MYSHVNDVQHTPVPKPPKMVKKNKKLRAKSYCEYCGIPKTRARLETHCIYTKGGSGPGYIPENTITLCAGPPNDCHGKAQEYKIKREELIELVAERLGRTVEDIMETLHLQRRCMFSG